MSITAYTDLQQINAELKDAPAQDIIRWAADAFGDGLVMTSSFGAQSAVMLHLATRVVADIPVLLVDTGYLFPETYRFAESLKDRLKLNLKLVTPKITPAYLEAVHGKLWEQGEAGMSEYLRLMKVEPLAEAMEAMGVTAWIAGLRRGQTDHRATLRHVELQNGRYKVHPILTWSTKDVHEYLKVHDLPYHPLYEQGYASIGDVHSTVPITAEQHEREGRFAGLRQECGIHLPATRAEDASRESSGL